MNLVEVTVEKIDQESWFDRVQGFCEEVLSGLGVDNWEVSVVICDKDTIHRLNREYRQKDAPTDVLSFVQEDDFSGSPIHYAGDIILSPPMVDKNCEQFGVEKEEEIKRLLIHGLLHLSGMTHDGYDPKEPMLVRQEELVQKYKEMRIL